MNNKDVLNLHKPPTSWVQLTGEQMEEIHRIANKSVSDEDYKMRVLFYLSGIRIVGMVNATIMVQHGKERAPITAEEIKYWIDKYMKFLDDNFAVFHNPYPDGLVIDGMHFKTPDPVCSSLCWQQVGEVQRAMKRWWDTSEQLRELKKKIDKWMTYQEYYDENYCVVPRPELDTKNILSQIKETEKEVRDARNTFLAHLLVPRKNEYLRSIRRWMGKFFTDQYVYNYEIAEQLYPIVDKIRNETFMVLYQQFQSAMVYYHKQFPLLFKTSKKKNTRTKDELIYEVSMLESVKKDAGYAMAEDVYRENFPVVLAELNDIAERAKMLEEPQSKINK